MCQGRSAHLLLCAARAQVSVIWIFDRTIFISCYCSMTTINKHVSPGKTWNTVLRAWLTRGISRPLGRRLSDSRPTVSAK